MVDAEAGEAAASLAGGVASAADHVDARPSAAVECGANRDQCILWSRKPVPMVAFVMDTGSCGAASPFQLTFQ